MRGPPPGPSVANMSIRLEALVIDAQEPTHLARFWSGVLEREIAGEDDGIVTLAAPDGPGFAIDFAPTDQPKTMPNKVHLDLTSLTSDDQQATVDRALRLGGQHIDIGQGPEETHVVLADPEGNEFCVIAAGNRFLAGCGTIGAINCDGTRQAGLFWRDVLDWPLVWDEGEETAIQSPHGGCKITWSGPPLIDRPPKNRWHFDLRPDHQSAEVERLEGLGARQVDIGQGDVDWVVMADPDGNEFCVLSGG